MMHPYELHSSNLDLLEVRHQLVSDQHPLARAGSIHHELFSPPDFLSRSFCQAFCLDFKSDPNPKLVAVTKSAISTIPGLCYVADLNTNLPQTFDVVKKLGIFPHTNTAKNYLMHGKLTDYGSHLHVERSHAPMSGAGYIGWKFSVYSFIRSTILGTVCYFTGAFIGSQPEFRAASDTPADSATVFGNASASALQSRAMDDLVKLASVEAVPTTIASPSLAAVTDSISSVSAISTISADPFAVNSAAVIAASAAEIKPTEPTDLFSYASSAIDCLCRPVASFISGFSRDHLPSANSTTYLSVQSGLSSFTNSVRSSCDDRRIPASYFHRLMVSLLFHLTTRLHRLYHFDRFRWLRSISGVRETRCKIWLFIRPVGERCRRLSYSRLSSPMPIQWLAQHYPISLYFSSRYCRLSLSP